MHTDRVNIFHITYDDCIVFGITHYFIFNFFIAFNALFNQHLMYRRKGKGIFHDLQKFRFIISKAAAGSPKGKSRAEDDRIADFFRCRQALFDRSCNIGRQNRLPKFFAKLLKKFPVLRTLNRTAFCSKKLRTAFREDAFSFKLHGKVQTCLAANARLKSRQGAHSG